MIRLHPRHPALVGILIGLLAFSPLLSAQNTKPVPVALYDDEVRNFLDRTESSTWDRTVALREQAVRDLESAKAQATVNPNSRLQGFQDENPAQRKVRIDKLIAAASTRIADCDNIFADFRTSAIRRMKADAVTIDCPVKSLPDALKLTASKLIVEAGKQGYDHLAVAGVFAPSRDTPSTPMNDAGLTTSLREAFAHAEGALPSGDAPKLDGKTLKPSPAKTGVIVAEVYPLNNFGGALWGARLIDGKTFRITGTMIAFVPEDKKAAAPSYSSPKTPVAYELVFEDHNNFRGHLGIADKWSFGVDASGPGAVLLTTALSRRETPELNAYAFLAAALGAPKTDPVSKAFWSLEPGVDAQNFQVTSHAATGGAHVPAGTLALNALTDEDLRARATAAQAAAQAAAEKARAAAAQTGAAGGIALPDTVDGMRGVFKALMSDHVHAESAFKFSRGTDREIQAGKAMAELNEKIRTTAAAIATKIETLAGQPVSAEAQKRNSSAVRQKNLQRLKDAVTTAVSNIRQTVADRMAAVARIDETTSAGLDSLNDWARYNAN